MNILFRISLLAATILLVVLVVEPIQNVRAIQTTKIDCYPIDGASKEKCEALGCVWQPVYNRKRETRHKPKQDEMFNQLEFDYNQENLDKIDAGITPSAIIKEPWCYFPDDFVGYKITQEQKRYKLTRVRPSALGNDIQELYVEVSVADKAGKVLRMKIYDVNAKRFEPELPKLNLAEGMAAKQSDFTYHLNKSSSEFYIKRQSTGGVIFSTDLSKLIFSDLFIQLNTKLDSPNVYGLGEHFDSFLKRIDKDYKTYSFYNTDKTPLPDGRRSYGGFPFYINFDSAKQKYAHGVYLHNSNGMDIILQPDQSVTFRPIGGILDFLFLTGPTPNDVIVQFQNLVGLPALPPIWSLGFHLCRYNYGTLEKTQLVWERTRDAGIPFDVQWNDIDYMERHNDFTYDHQKFAGLPDFVRNSLHKNNMHYMILFDPGLSQEDNFYPYKLGVEMDIFIKNSTNQTLVGKVWNDSGRTVFPDFSNPKSIEYWTKLFVKFQEELPYDGAWIDMNDISNFVFGSLDGCPMDNYLEMAPYKPGGYSLQEKTLCLSAKHMKGNEYDLHNLYSFYEAIATYKALAKARPNKRPFVISRSTAPGQNSYGGHWSGDVISSWDYLRWSIPSLIEHSMYGYSMMGTDICGFIGNTNPELCARWSTLGAFYTFSRNHNDDKSIDQDPVALGKDVVQANVNAQTNRYALLPYLYSLIFKASKFGEPVIRSVPFEFYDSDPEALNVEYQFLWGKALMISPIVHENTYSKRTYLPKGRWYESNIELKSQNNTFVKGPKIIDSKGEWYETNGVGLSDLPLFYQGGYIIPVYTNVQATTADTIKDQPISLRIALDEDKSALGELYIDEGDNVDGKYNYARMEMAKNKLYIIQDASDFKQSLPFGHVVIFGVTSKITSVRINGSIPFKQYGHIVAFDINAPVTRDYPIVVELVE